MSELHTLLDETLGFLKRYVVFASAEQADAVALWCGYTWFYDQFDTAPYLAVQAPARRSGKTRVLECLELVVRKPQMAGGTTAAALVRLVHLEHPTLLVDEVDTLFGRRNDPSSEDLRGLFNNGYRRGKPYLKMVGEGKKMHVERFDPFGPKALAGIGKLPDTVQDRGITVGLKRRMRSEPITKFRMRRADRESLSIREWSQTSATSWPSIPAISHPPDRTGRLAGHVRRQHDLPRPWRLLLVRLHPVGALSGAA